MRHVVGLVQARVSFALSIALLVVVSLGWMERAVAQSNICAQVQIEIPQKLTLERQAFDAVMRINNGLDGTPLENIRIDLTFFDQAGNSVKATSDPNDTSASFFVRVDSLTGINAVDGTGSVAPKTTGEVHWLIIPAAGAGGTQPSGKMYFIGANLTYVLLNESKTVAVTPDFVTVSPQPLLALDYFLAGDVYADDPSTPEIEPPVPFTFGVRIKNVGGGTASKTTIDSMQPKIVDNKQGLLIGFQIVDGFIDDQPAEKTLLLNFGDIGAATSRTGRWDMVTTLSGRFTDVQAKYTHADSLGGASTSLIQSVNAHLLIHDVRVDLAGRDGVLDFLAIDGSAIKVYESEGIDTQVIDQSANAQFQLGSGGQYSLNFPATTGFAYVKVTDPSSGLSAPVSVVRSDGKKLPAENAWLSKTRNDQTWSYFVNFFDVDTTGKYTIGLANSGGAALSGSVYNDANNNGARDPDESGIGAVAITLTGTDTQGASVNTVGSTNPDGSYRFAQLKPGTYSLQVSAVTGYVDGILKAGSAGGAVTGGSISGIVLGTDTGASGYLFAKRTASPPLQADLAITMNADTTTALLGSNVTFTINASNLGPATASHSQVTDVLPSGFTFIGATSVGGGTFDSSSGTWTIGDFATGAKATLTLIAKVASSSAPIINTASIASVTVDLNTANNKASVTINPDAGSLKVTQSLLGDARVLALVSCALSSGQDDPACLSTRAGFLGNYLSMLGYASNVTTDSDSFRSAMRSGRYNTYWISGGAQKLTGTLAQEVREATFRGDELIVDGTRNANSAVFDDVTGVTVGTGSLGVDQPITIVGLAGTVATSGDALPLMANGGQTRATFVGSNSSPAIVANAYGHGHGTVFGFDLVGSLLQSSPGGALPTFVSQLVGAIANPVDPVVGAAYVPLTTSIENRGADATIDVSTTLPAGVTMVDATPSPTSVTPTLVNWHFALAAGSTKFIDLGVRAPTISGQYKIDTTVNKGDNAATTLYGQYSLPLNVFASDQFGPPLISDLLALNLPNGSEQQSRNQATAALQDGQANFSANRFEDSIAQFLAAADALDQINSMDLSIPLTTIDKWTQESELRWSSAALAPGCFNDVSASATVVSSGVTLNRTTSRFTQKIQVIANQPISGPIVLQFANLSTNATLFQATGATLDCNAPAGSPFITLSPIDLPAGASASITLEFTDPSRAAISYTLQVLSGSSGNP